MSDEPGFGPLILCPSCARYVHVPDVSTADSPTCPRCGRRLQAPHRTEREESSEDDGEDVPLLSPTYALGGMLYFAGAVIAFCGIPQLDDEGMAWPLGGWVGVLGAVLLAVAPRSGPIRSLGLIGVFASGLFIDKHPVVFLVGAAMMIAGIATAHLDPPSTSAPAEDDANEDDAW